MIMQPWKNYVFVFCFTCKQIENILYFTVEDL